MTVADFRTNFPEFASLTTYPDTLVTFWLGFAALRFTETVWGTMLPYALQLYTAHTLVLARRNGSSGSGSAGGASSGFAVSKQVDKLSVSYDVNVGLIEGAGPYNLTTYGTQLYELILLAGMGGVQLGAGPNLDLLVTGYTPPLYLP